MAADILPNCLTVGEGFVIYDIIPDNFTFGKAICFSCHTVRKLEKEFSFPSSQISSNCSLTEPHSIKTFFSFLPACEKLTVFHNSLSLLYLQKNRLTQNWEPIYVAMLHWDRNGLHLNLLLHHPGRS